MLKVFFYISLLIAFANCSYAHPHVFVDAEVELVFENDKIIKVRQLWKFDEFFSSNIIDDFDADKDGKFNQDEIIQVRNNAFENLKNYNFFNNIFYGDKKIDKIEYVSFEAKIDNKQVVYDFTIKLEEPINPTKELTSIGLYDPEFFVDIAYVNKNPVVLKNNKQICNYQIREDKKNPIFMGFVNPKTIYLDCQ